MAKAKENEQKESDTQQPAPKPVDLKPLIDAVGKGASDVVQAVSESQPAGLIPVRKIVIQDGRERREVGQQVYHRIDSLTNDTITEILISPVYPVAEIRYKSGFIERLIGMAVVAELPTITPEDAESEGEDSKGA